MSAGSSGYPARPKIFDRYKEHGLEALSDRSRRPVRYANQLPEQIEGLIVRLKAEKPHWGARKIRELLVRRLDGDIRVPAKSTIHAVLDRHGLVKRSGGPRHRSARGCHPCLRYDLLPMCPGWTNNILAEGVGFEPTVPLQARRFSRPVP